MSYLVSRNCNSTSPEGSELPTVLAPRFVQASEQAQLTLRAVHALTSLHPAHGIDAPLVGTPDRFLLIQMRRDATLEGRFFSSSDDALRLLTENALEWEQPLELVDLGDPETRGPLRVHPFVATVKVEGGTRQRELSSLVWRDRLASVADLHPSLPLPQQDLANMMGEGMGRYVALMDTIGGGFQIFGRSQKKLAHELSLQVTGSVPSRFVAAYDLGGTDGLSPLRVRTRVTLGPSTAFVVPPTSTP